MADEATNPPTVLEAVQLFMGRIAMLEARLAAVEKMQSDDADDAGLQFWPQGDSGAEQLDTCTIRGNQLTIAGTRARFIEFALDGSYAAWTATPTFPWATDGSVGYYDTHDNYTVEFCWGQ